MIPKTLQLAVTAHPDESASALELGHLCGKFWKRELVLTEPPATPFGFFVDDAMRREVVELHVVVNVGGLVEIVFAEGSAVIHDQRRSLRDAGLREHLQHVLATRRRHLPQLSACVRPGYVSERLAVRRPCRLKFPSVAARHTSR